MFELASLQDSNLKSKKKFTEHLEDIDKRYGKLYMQFLKEVLIDEFKDWDSVIAKLKSIGFLNILILIKENLKLQKKKKKKTKKNQLLMLKSL